MPRKRTETAIGGRDGIAYTYPLHHARKRRHGAGNGIAGDCPGNKKPAHGGQQKTRGFDAAGRGLDVSGVMN